MTHREQILQQILERFTELIDPMQSGNGNGDNGLRLMPATYTDTVREVERLLKQMPHERPKQHRHLYARYISRTQALKDVPVKRKTKHGKTITVLERQLVDQYPKWVRNHTVELGITWLADNWTLNHEPMLPDALLATSKSDDRAAQRTAA